MGLSERITLYKQIESKRQRPLIVYVTSPRRNANGQMASDAIPAVLDQFMALPERCDKVDILIVSSGGDPTVAWRVMSLLREKVNHIGVIIPQMAFSAATLLALGADEIIMHPCGNLGPIDPQISANRTIPGTNHTQTVQFSTEDLVGLLSYAKDEVQLTDQQYRKDVFEMICKEAGPLAIGFSHRTIKMSYSLSKKLLKMHMREDKDGEGKKADQIVEALNKDYFHHGYPVGRTEAKDLGLNIPDRDEELEDLIWDVWKDIESEFNFRQPFSPNDLVLKNPQAGPLLLQGTSILNLPTNLPPQLIQQIMSQILPSITVSTIPPTDFQYCLAVIESTRNAQRFLASGKIFAIRQPDSTIAMNVVKSSEEWVELPTS